MRNIPVDISKFTFVCVAPPRPKLVSQETGEVKVDKEGNTVYQVGLSAADAMGRIDLVQVAVSGEPEITIGQIVIPIGLTGSQWQREVNGRDRAGVAFRADEIVPAVQSGKAAA